MPGKSKARQLVEQEIREAAQIALGTLQSRYFKAFDRRAHGYALLGCSNEEIAELLGIDRDTFAKWTVEYPSLAKAIHSARFDANVKVVDALHRAARGFKHRETKLNVVGGRLEKTTITKAYPPNVHAATLILANRMGKHWKDAKTVEHSGAISLAALVDQSYGDKAKPVEAQVIDAEPTTSSADEA